MMEFSGLRLLDQPQRHGSAAGGLRAALRSRFGHGAIATGEESVVVAVPSLFADGRPLDHAALVARVTECLAQLFGGATAVPGRGLDLDDSGPEQVTLVFSVMTQEDIEAATQPLIELIAELHRDWGQRAVFMMTQREWFIVSAEAGQ